MVLSSTIRLGATHISTRWQVPECSGILWISAGNKNLLDVVKTLAVIKMVVWQSIQGTINVGPFFPKEKTTKPPTPHHHL
jgi:hypothetical protein